MPDIYKTIVLFKADLKGATAIEYGLIAAGVAVAIFGAVYGFGDELVIMYDDLGASLLRGRT